MFWYPMNDNKTEIIFLKTWASNLNILYIGEISFKSLLIVILNFHQQYFVDLYIFPKDLIPKGSEMSTIGELSI